MLTVIGSATGIGTGRSAVTRTGIVNATEIGIVTGGTQVGAIQIRPFSHADTAQVVVDEVVIIGSPKKDEA